MDKFGFIFHPHDIPSLGDWILHEPNLKLKRRRVAERALRWLPPFRRETVQGVKSVLGKEIEGEMILWPMIPEQIVNMSSDFTLSKLIEAGQVAQDLGAKIVGLGAYSALIGKRGVALSKALDIAVTTGTSYTIVTVVDAVLAAAAAVGISISNSSVAVVGATGSIGSVASQLIARYVGQLILVARNRTKLSKLEETIKNSGQAPPQLKIMSDIRQAVSEANIVVVVTNSPSTVVNVEDVMPGTVICDISLPHNVSAEDAKKRQDILVIDGGIVKPPGECDFHFDTGIPPGLVFACMAETMILTLEEIFEDFSLGGNITIEKVELIQQLGKKHGFSLAEFESFGEKVSEDRIESVRKVAYVR